VYNYIINKTTTKKTKIRKRLANMKKSIYEQNIFGAGIYLATGVSIKAVDSWTQKDVKAWNEMEKKLQRAFRVYNVNPCYYGEYETAAAEYSVTYTQNGNDCEIKAVRTIGMYDDRGLRYRITVNKQNVSKGYREYSLGSAWSLGSDKYNLDEDGQRIV
jgi:hypothetical protein